MNKFTMLVGLPGAGKSSYTKKLDGIVYASDTLRKELFGDENVQDKNNEVFAELHKRVKQSLIDGRDVIFDATNISYKNRMSFLQSIKDINCIKKCILIATPYNDCLKQNSLRERKVPEEVITKMYKNFNIPFYREGWDSIKIEWNFIKEDFSFYELFHGENGLLKINHDCKFHTLTIGEHCNKCFDITANLTNNSDLVIAAIYHDIGKRFTKEFNEKKGYYTYYQHHLVSAYDSLFYLKTREYEDNEILNICNYIQWHMQPFFIQTEKQRDKFIELVGSKFYNDLMILHKADVMAK